MRKLLFIVLLIVSRLNLAQEAQGENTVQPTIMVIPFTKEGEDIRTIIEEDPNKRISMSEVKQGFDSRGFTTLDFRAKLKAATQNSALSGMDQTSIKRQIIENSGADIYVEVDYILTASDNGNMVEIILEGYDAYSAQSLSNATGRSRIFRTDKLGILAEQATESCIEDFLNVMNEKFANIVENGRTITLSFTLSETSTYDMNTRIGDKDIPLKFAIRKWLKEKSYKGYYHLQGSSAANITVDDFRIPLKNEYGENYQIDEFEFEVFNFFDDMGMDATTSIVGTSMQISIN
ncbi:MAG: DUF6175 family protein [Cytophagales bacterium]|nr:DUF6175 family protein [Cytophagales bacterium]